MRRRRGDAATVGQWRRRRAWRLGQSNRSPSPWCRARGGPTRRRSALSRKRQAALRPLPCYEPGAAAQMPAVPGRIVDDARLWGLTSCRLAHERGPNLARHLGAEEEVPGDLVKEPGVLSSFPGWMVAWYSMVVSTVSRSNVELTARPTSPNAVSFSTDWVSSPVLACSSLSNRALSMAIAAWSAKVSIRVIWLSLNLRTVGLVMMITPRSSLGRSIGIASR